jgi:hypothetical protein
MDGGLHLRKIFWILTLLATVVGGVYFALTIVRAANATQQMAGILQAIGTALIPYIFTKSLEGLRHSDVMRVRIVGPDRPAPPPPLPRDEPNYAIPEPPARR